MKDQYRNTTPEEFLGTGIAPEPPKLLDFRMAELMPGGMRASVMQADIDSFSLALTGIYPVSVTLHLDRAGLDALSDMLLRAVEDAPRPGPA